MEISITPYSISGMNGTLNLTLPAKKKTTSPNKIADIKSKTTCCFTNKVEIIIKKDVVYTKTFIRRLSSKLMPFIIK